MRTLDPERRSPIRRDYLFTGLRAGSETGASRFMGSFDLQLWRRIGTINLGLGFGAPA
ncbi:MAG: hypothetical protein HY735_33525 [Verrucomicrobia bacterium]|nr:hypothetical protein [Verrucomicrobiota bacterium]